MEREFVVIEEFSKYNDDELVDVQARLEEETAAVIEEVREENKRRADVAIAAALERARKSGVRTSVAPTGEAPKKRGRKSSAEKAAESVAPESYEETDDLAVQLDAE